MIKVFREKRKTGGWLIIPYDTDLVKDECVRCNQQIHNPIKNYEVRGNWCSKCVTEIYELAQLVKIEERLKKQRDEAKRINYSG